MLLLLFLLVLIDPASLLVKKSRYEGTWREVYNIASAAPWEVRAQAGDTVKSSIAHTMSRDTRDYPPLPRSGYLLRLTQVRACVRAV